MKCKNLSVAIFLWLYVSIVMVANPVCPVADLLDRVGGKGTSQRIELVLDERISEDGCDVFVISSRHGKPLLKGSSLSALTVGAGWYLNHFVHAGISWSNLTVDMSEMKFPVPDKDYRHECRIPCRYYLNYCTFSYSMSFWTEDRWMKEVDWMALHGVNMPLMLVGADVVWRNVCRELGYTEEDISEYIAGPGFQAWWLMNNLQGWGGPNPGWWYERQEKLCRSILSRMRELGMEPVLPGYSGMVPHNAAKKQGLNIADPGRWCSGFQRPGFLLPTDESFDRISEIYYRHLEALMGTSRYYSMDPFHEGGSTKGVNVGEAYRVIYENMQKASSGSTWVIQSWQDNPRRAALESVPKGGFLVLDLFSDGMPKWQDGYHGHDFVWCMLNNYGGRSGIHGRFKGTIDGFFDAIEKFPHECRGIGATPEGIETNPIMYDLLFELPWMQDRPDVDKWIDTYVEARYGRKSDVMSQAWKLLVGSALDCRTSQQGASEPVVCARPSLHVKSVSSWSTSEIYYDPGMVREAAALMKSVSSEMTGNRNYDYDLTDVVRQTMADSAYFLLKNISASYHAGNKAEFRKGYETYLDLILELDRLLARNRDFTLDKWTRSARDVCDEVEGTTQADRDWMEWNSRSLVSIWGPRQSAEHGGLRDYSNRMWAGLLKDFYYPRWERFFRSLENGDYDASSVDWFAADSLWTRCVSGHADTLSVVTYNLRFGEMATMKQLSDYISDQKPDIVALQECDWNTHRESVPHQHDVQFVNELAYHTGMFGVFGNAINFSGGYYGIGILSRYPIIGYERVLLPNNHGREQRAMIVARIELPSKNTLTFCCTHLDVSSPELRRRQLDFISSYLNDYGPVVLAGDLNADPEELEFMNKQWMDVTGSSFTFPAADPDKKIDYIYVNPYERFRLIGTETMEDMGLSDHLLLKSEILFLNN